MKPKDCIKDLDGELNHLLPRGIVTGNCEGEAEKSDKPDTSESEKSQNDSTLPKWLSTNPEILAGQMQDLLALMQQTGWFVFLMPVTVQIPNGERTALRITISPKLPVSIGIGSSDDGQFIVINGVPVTDGKHL